jgi:hypothetical protein
VDGARWPIQQAGSVYFKVCKVGPELGGIAEERASGTAALRLRCALAKHVRGALHPKQVRAVTGKLYRAV